MTICWCDTDTSITPSLQEAQVAFPQYKLQNSSSPGKMCTLMYNPPPENLIWTDINSAAPSYDMRFYAYTDNAALGSPTTATQLFATKMRAWIKFRGRRES